MHDCPRNEAKNRNRSKGRERDGQASVEYELPGANKATKQTILRHYADRKLANRKARQKDKRVRGEDGGGRRETGAGNNSDDDDGTSTTAHLRFNHFSHSVMIPHIKPARTSGKNTHF